MTSESISYEKLLVCLLRRGRWSIQFTEELKLFEIWRCVFIDFWHFYVPKSSARKIFTHPIDLAALARLVCVPIANTTTMTRILSWLAMPAEVARGHRCLKRSAGRNNLWRNFLDFKLSKINDFFVVFSNLSGNSLHRWNWTRSSQQMSHLKPWQWHNFARIWAIHIQLHFELSLFISI